MLCLPVMIDEMRDAWRSESDPSLERRRKIALLSVVGLLDFGIISLYQLGVIRSLPDFPGRVFDSDCVNASRKAFAMGLPDGTTGALLYAVNLVFLSFGGTRRTGRHPLWSFALAGTVVAGAGAALVYLHDMAFKQEKACPYCITGAGLNLGMVPYAMAEVREAFADLRTVP